MSVAVQVYAARGWTNITGLSNIAEQCYSMMNMNLWNYFEKQYINSAHAYYYQFKFTK